MKVLFIGGTGNISLAITQLLEKDESVELYLLNRGNNNHSLSDRVKIINADIYDVSSVKRALGDLKFDVVADFIAFEVEHVKRDVELFRNRTKQYIFISSASIYQKPQINYLISESSPTSNPYWDYSQNKIACEEYLMSEYRQNQFPITIVRPSHTYGDTSIPLSLHGAAGSFQIVKRMIKGKKVIIPGDGTTYWTLTHNSDFATAFVGLMGNVHAIGEAVNIISGEALTWNRIYEIVADAVGAKLNAVHIASDFIIAADDGTFGPLLGDKSVNLVFDNSKLKKLVPGFAPRVRFDQGVVKAVKYALEHEHLYVDDEAYEKWYDELIEYYEDMTRNVPRLKTFYE